MSEETRIPMRVARTGMVASANPTVSAIGVEVLRQGGNAVDAAITMGFAVAVMQPHLSHFGGDLFMQIYNPETRTAYALNGSGAAPSGATIEAMGDEIPLRGIRAAAVPGVVNGWMTALDQWGTWTPEQVAAPAIELCERGFAIPSWQVGLLNAHAELWEQFPASGQAFMPDDLRIGSILTQPDLARTIRAIARGGASAFYEGEFADKLVAYSKANGGFYEKGDLAKHRSIITDPIKTTYRGNITVTEQPPVSQGHILLEMLNIFENFDPTGLTPESPEVIHAMVEAKKLAFADRYAYMGDIPDAPIDILLSKEHAARQARRIDPARASAGYTAGAIDAGKYGSDTTSLCVIDKNGLAVSHIQSLFHNFGSGVVIPGTGVCLNNRMTGFSLDPNSPNALAPGKKTMHTLNTYMLFKDGQFWGVGQSPGGDVQVQTNFQVITQMVDFGRNPQEAIESPKWNVPPDGPSINIEDRMPLDVCYELRKRGHDLGIGGPWSGSCASQCILLDHGTGSLFAGSDPRANGLALGY
jgi:gamma-glutamyltranspeptidase/glutathione hydrolase